MSDLGTSDPVILQFQQARGADKQDVVLWRSIIYLGAIALPCVLTPKCVARHSKTLVKGKR